MDLKTKWEQLHQSKLSESTISEEDMKLAFKTESKLAVSQLIRSLRVNAYWGIAIIFCIFSLMLLSRGSWEALLTLGVLNCILIAGFILLRFKTKELRVQSEEENNVKAHIKLTLSIVNKAFRQERIYYAICGPIIIICSMLYSKIIGGHSIAEAFNNTHFFKVVLLSMIIISPLSYHLGKLLTKKGFEPYINQLEAILAQTEEH
ncbi:MAG: hypothetical protein N4A71_28250 [Carboxylicivirga sp.]|jgi:Na+/melibiose symporter-like transporter|nr:hypothetical protein [Carboxylicivirga sp.]